MFRIVIACPTRARFTLGDLPDDLGGIERASVSLARALAARGHDVVLATRGGTGASLDGVRDVALDDAGREPCDVLVSSNDARPFDGAWAKRTVLWIHNPLPLAKAWRRGQVRPIWRHRPVAVFVGTGSEATVPRVYPFARRVVVPHGLEDVFRFAPVDGAREPRFVFASQKQRGLAPLLAAWANRKPVGRAALDVYGTAAAEVGWGIERADRHGIVFHARQGRADLARAYAGVTAMLCPGAHDETFCLAAAEAQAMGLPLLTLGIGALAERVRHGVDGLLCRSYPDLVRAAALLLDQPELWRNLHEGALLQRDALTWERAAVLWETLVLG